MSTDLDTIKGKSLRQVANVRELLINDAAKKQIAGVAAKHLNAERITRIVMNSLRLNPKLGEAEPMSMLGAVMTCAALGLEPDPMLGFAYLVPFRNNRKGVTEVQTIIGYRGLIDLARRSGHITSISANIHYDDDLLWIHEEGTEATLRHQPGDQDGKPLHAYAIAKFKDGGHAYVVLPWKHVMKIRDGSQGWQTAVKFGATAKSPWFTHEAEMAKKTAIRALAKYLPLSVEMRQALDVDENRVDFRSFAMGAAAEAMPEIDEDDGKTIDAEVAAPEGTEKSAEPAEEQSAPPAPKRADPKAAAAAAAEKARAAAGKPEAKPAAAAAPKDEDVAEASAWEVIAGQIKGEIDSAAPADVSDILDLWSDKLDPMKREAPELFSEIQIHAARRENSGAEG